MFHLGERFVFSLFTEVSVMVFFMSIAFTERIPWTCWHFASISYGKSIAIAITGIPSYHTFVQSVWWTRIFLFKGASNSFKHFSNSHTLKDEYYRYLKDDATILY